MKNFLLIAAIIAAALLIYPYLGLSKQKALPARSSEVYAPEPRIPEQRVKPSYTPAKVQKPSSDADSNRLSDIEDLLK